MIVFLKERFDKVYFEKNQETTTIVEKLPGMQRGKIIKFALFLPITIFLTQLLMYSLVAYVTNVMNPDQTAPSQPGNHQVSISFQ